MFVPHWVDGLIPMYPRDTDKLKEGLTVAAARALPNQQAEEAEHMQEERRLAHVVGYIASPMPDRKSATPIFSVPRRVSVTCAGSDQGNGAPVHLCLPL